MTLKQFTLFQKVVGEGTDKVRPAGCFVSLQTCRHSTTVSVFHTDFRLVGVRKGTCSIHSSSETSVKYDFDAEGSGGSVGTGWVAACDWSRRCDSL